MSDKSSEKPEMTFTAEAIRSEMRQRVRTIAALSPEDNRKAALRFTAMVLRLPYDRVRRLFYGEARRVDAHEADQIRAYCEHAQDLIQKRADYEAERARFIAEAHPALGRLVPPAIGVAARTPKRGRGA
jgi:hypothetical protein